jgi:hypothetical protein
MRHKKLFMNTFLMNGLRNCRLAGRENVRWNLRLVRSEDTREFVVLSVIDP